MNDAKSTTFSLIDLTPIASVTNNLIDKLAQAIGWTAIHDTPNRQAVQCYIKEIEKSNLDPIVKAAKISKAKKSIKEYINQHNIIAKASTYLPSTCNPYDLDNDWLALFMDKARLINSEELQIIWSKVLAQECENAGSIPLQLLDILSVLSRDLAESFLILCGFSVSILNQTNPMIGLGNQDYFDKHNLLFDDIMNLSSIGLVCTSSSGFVLKSRDIAQIQSVKIRNKAFALTSIEKNELSVGYVQFTRCGEALSKILSPSTPEDFSDYCLKYWKSFSHANFTPISE